MFLTDWGIDRERNDKILAFSLFFVVTSVFYKYQKTFLLNTHSSYVLVMAVLSRQATFGVLPHTRYAFVLSWVNSNVLNY